MVFSLCEPTKINFWLTNGLNDVNEIFWLFANPGYERIPGRGGKPSEKGAEKGIASRSARVVAKEGGSVMTIQSTRARIMIMTTYI